LRQTDA